MARRSPPHGSPTETEVKIAITKPSFVARSLLQAGFKRRRPRTFEANVLLDTADQRLRQAGSVLRVRQFGKQALLTFKGPAAAGRHKSREELETTVGSSECLLSVLEKLGFVPVFRYEKYRTEYTDGEGLATIDETPIGNFVELEGSPPWIDRTAQRLGWSAQEYITESYVRLYEEECQRRGVKPSNMTF
ncbi:MAG: class IV adenylate cyclase [Bryobacteraceae bacterium]|nr:class IV adenylate cyclase [Bryobacteraceae bacterium]MDW8379090.1 class IV adenylate cyclase [Bryobacterales bacterium]